MKRAWALAVLLLLASAGSAFAQELEQVLDRFAAEGLLR